MNWDETTPCSLPPTTLFQNGGMLLLLQLSVYVFSVEILHIVVESLLACVWLGQRGEVWRVLTLDIALLV